jgi:Right handed beta helix region
VRIAELLSRLLAVLGGLVGTGAPPAAAEPWPDEQACPLRWDRWHAPSRYLNGRRMPTIAIEHPGWVVLGRAEYRRSLVRGWWRERRRRQGRYTKYRSEQYVYERQRSRLANLRWARLAVHLPRPLRVAIVAALIPPIMGAAGANYYVAPASAGGSDANNGTSPATPKATIGAGIALTGTGDFLNLMAGNHPFFATSTTRSSVTVQNYQNDVVTITRAHSGVDWAGNAGIVCSWTGAWTNCTFRSVGAGSITISHTGTPSMAGPAPSGATYLAVGNGHINAPPGGSYAGIRIAGGSGWLISGIFVDTVFAYGINLNNSDDAVIAGCDISGTASGVWTNADNVTIQDCEIFDNGYMLRDGSEEDTGANGVQLSGASNWTITNCIIHGNWSRTGSQQFGAEGGAVEYFDIVDGTGGAIIGCTFYENHNFIETGVGSGHNVGWSGGGPNAEIAYNTIYGKNDYQDVTAGTTQALGGLSNNSNPDGSTSWLLVRALIDTDIHNNVWDVVGGSPSNAGIRTQTGGGFDGQFSGNLLRNNVFYVRLHPNGSGTPVYNFNGTGIPSGWTVRNNIIYYTFDRGTSPVMASTGTANDYTLAQGPAAAFAGVGLCQGDVWGDVNTNAAAANPDFVDPDNATMLSRNYHLLAGSPAIGAADDGGDIGAFDFSTPLLPHVTVQMG